MILRRQLWFRKPERLHIDDLPKELLQVIFMNCVASRTEDNRNRLGNHSSRPPNPPCHILSQVSSRWRAVALAAPSLWADLGPIVLRSEHLSRGQAAKSLYERTKTYLERSKSHPLQFSFDYIERDTWAVELHRKGPCTALRVFRHLVRHSSRWEDVSLKIHHEALPRLDRVKGTLAALRRLSILVDYHDAVPSPTTRLVVDHFADAPALVHVDCAFQSKIASERTAIKFPWHQLAVYCAKVSPSQLGSQGLLKVLAATPNRIRDLQSRYSGPLNNESILQVPPAIKYQQCHLTNLCLRIETNASILRECRFPALATLSLTLGNLESPGDSDTLTIPRISDVASLVKNSDHLPTLTTLSLMCCMETWLLEQGVLIDILRMCSGVRKLKTNYIPTDTLEALEQTNPTLVPDLESLKIIEKHCQPIFEHIDCVALDAVAKARDDMFREGSSTRLSVVFTSLVHTKQPRGEKGHKFKTPEEWYAQLTSLGESNEPPQDDEQYLRWARKLRLERGHKFKYRSFSPHYYKQSMRIHRALNEIKDCGIDGVEIRSIVVRSQEVIRGNDHRKLT